MADAPAADAARRSLDALIVEDEPDDATLLVHRLREAGYALRWRRVETEPAFLEALREPPDIIFSDFSMPRFSGLRALELLRASGLDVPLILISGTVGEDVAVEAMRLGATDYLLKDRIARLPSAVERALADRALRGERRATQEALRSSDQRLRSIVERTMDCIMVVGPDGAIAEMNHAGLAMLQSDDLAGVRGRPFAQFLLPAHRPAFEAMHRRVLAGASELLTVEVRGCRGRGRWLEIQAGPLLDGAKRVEAAICITRDISERVALEERLRQSHRLEAVGQLTGGVAHDFNNLLTVILGDAELICERAGADAELRELSTMIVDAARSAAELTKGLLAFARRQALNPSAVDPNAMIAEMHPLLKRTLGEHIEIALALADEPWSALVDSAQLENALLNLCINSRDAMPGGGRLTISTANARLDRECAARLGDLKPGEYVRITVTDSGCGIAPELLNRVFEPFFTTKDKSGGTGLGLAMVYGFIKQSGGHIGIRSEPGRGTTVQMHLPRAAAGAAAATDATGTFGVLHGSETILLVEDNEHVRRFAAGSLEGLGYRVLQAANGAGALDVLGGHEAVDLLFTDVEMPGGMSGRELAEAARARRPALKVLYTSGYAADAIVHHGRLDPGVQLLSKPYRRGELARRIRGVLDSS